RPPAPAGGQGERRAGPGTGSEPEPLPAPRRERTDPPAVRASQCALRRAGRDRRPGVAARPRSTRRNGRGDLHGRPARPHLQPVLHRQVAKIASCFAAPRRQNSGMAPHHAARLRLLALCVAAFARTAAYAAVTVVSLKLLLNHDYASYRPGTLAAWLGFCAVPALVLIPLIGPLAGSRW